MAFLTCNFQSRVLGTNAEMNVYIPDKFRDIEREGGFPVLYLLHGQTGDHTSWVTKSSIHRYAEDKGIIVVMPRVGNSFYTDMKYGDQIYTFISQELIKFCQNTFPISNKREDRFIVGVSMGGYGAFKFALSNPESFAAVASLSGALDIVDLMQRKSDSPILRNIANAIWGDNQYPEEKDDLFQLLDKAVKCGADLPKAYIICGTEDFLYQDNIKFSQQLKKYVPDVKIQWEQGDHEWSFWDKYIQEVLKWLPVKI